MVVLTLRVGVGFCGGGGRFKIHSKFLIASVVRYRAPYEPSDYCEFACGSHARELIRDCLIDLITNQFTTHLLRD